jgi:CheY-like chemotaxis protein
MRRIGTAGASAAPMSGGAGTAEETVPMWPRPRLPRSAPRRPTRILLVNADPDILRVLSARLLDEGYWVTAVSSFQLGKELLRAARPDLLIAGSRLAAYNGLHLAALSRFEYPNRPVIVTHTSHDAFLEAEAERLDAKFAVSAEANAGGSIDLLQLVKTSLEPRRQSLPAIRRWPRKAVLGTLDARVGPTAARVVDLSYGGLKLEFLGSAGELSRVFEIALPEGLTLTASRVWSGSCSAAGGHMCGVRVLSAEGHTANKWRQLVDSIR